MTLEELYARVPDIDCKGLCHTYCGPIEMSELERQRIARQGVRIKPAVDALRDDVTQCPALSPLGRCTVYAQRPLICRLWGVTEGLSCEYGCKPKDGRYLTDQEAYALIGESLQISQD